MPISPQLPSGNAVAITIEKLWAIVWARVTDVINRSYIISIKIFNLNFLKLKEKVVGVRI